MGISMSERIEVPFVYLLCNALFLDTAATSSSLRIDGSGPRTGLAGDIRLLNYQLIYRQRIDYWATDWEEAYELG